MRGPRKICFVDRFSTKRLRLQVTTALRAGFAPDDTTGGAMLDERRRVRFTAPDNEIMYL
jgi:hypothetical protein